MLNSCKGEGGVDCGDLVERCEENLPRYRRSVASRAVASAAALVVLIFVEAHFFVRAAGSPIYYVPSLVCGATIVLFGWLVVYYTHKYNVSAGACSDLSESCGPQQN